MNRIFLGLTIVIAVLSVSAPTLTALTIVELPRHLHTCTA
jgi:hypothetical protein